MFFVSVLAVLYPVQTHPQCVKRYFDKEDISLMTICPWHATNVSENPEMQRIQSYVNSMYIYIMVMERKRKVDSPSRKH